MLAHGQVIGGARWHKGRILTADDVRAAHGAGLASLSVARLEPGDFSEDAAAAALGAALAGSGVRALAAVHGRCNLAAETDGVLTFDAAMVAAVNRCDEALTLGTLLPFARVRGGEIVATVKTIRYGVDAAAVAAACAAAAVMTVHGFTPQRARLLQTRLDGVSDKAIAKTVRVTRARLERLGCTMTSAPPLLHDAADLAAALLANADADLLLVASASASVDRGDIVPAAIVAAGGSVVRLGMPVDPGNLLVLGALAGRPVIGLPGCARSPKRGGLDLVLERLVAGLAVGADDIALMGVGGLLPDAERPDPQPRLVA